MPWRNEKAEWSDKERYVGSQFTGDSHAMSRSRRKTPIAGISSATSEKAEKAADHRRERRRVRQVLIAEPDSDLLPHTWELSNTWAMAKEGQVYRASWKDPSHCRRWHRRAAALLRRNGASQPS